MKIRSYLKHLDQIWENMWISSTAICLYNNWSEDVHVPSPHGKKRRLRLVVNGRNVEGQQFGLCFINPFAIIIRCRVTGEMLRRLKYCWASLDEGLRALLMT